MSAIDAKLAIERMAESDLFGLYIKLDQWVQSSGSEVRPGTLCEVCGLTRFGRVFCTDCAQLASSAILSRLTALTAQKS